MSHANNEDSAPRRLRVLAFAASLQKNSLNRRLIELASGIASGNNTSVDLANFQEFDAPLYNADVNEAVGLPQGVLHFNRRLDVADAVMIAAPEYNYSISGVLKNLIDWVSRARPMPWRGKCIYLLAAAPSPMGGIRGLWQTRIPLEGCGAFVFPEMFALAHADKAFNDVGALWDDALAQRLHHEVENFTRLARTIARNQKGPM